MTLLLRVSAYIGHLDGGVCQRKKNFFANYVTDVKLKYTCSVQYILKYSKLGHLRTRVT